MSDRSVRATPIFDYIWHGQYFRHFANPPRIIPETMGFEDALRESIPQKIEELLNRASELRNERDSRLVKIKGKYKRETIDEYFNTAIIMYDFAEYFVVQKWIKYWIKLWYKITPQALPDNVFKRSTQLTQDEIEKARQALVESQYEGVLRKVGSRYAGLCPFHQEKTPSFYIFADNHWYCFGACAQGGDVIQFVMKLKGMTFPEAVRYLL